VKEHEKPFQARKILTALIVEIKLRSTIILTAMERTGIKSIQFVAHVMQRGNSREALEEFVDAVFLSVQEWRKDFSLLKLEKDSEETKKCQLS